MYVHNGNLMAQKLDSLNNKEDINTHSSIVTFGCRLNTYESEVMKGLLKDHGLENIKIINTCAVTKEAERQAKQAIRRLKRENPDIKIVVTGCGAQINPEKYASMPEIDKVIGNQEKMQPETYKNLAKDFDDHPKIVVTDIMEIKETASHMVKHFDERARAFVQIQNGCNHRCTFCTIPFGRGNNRSVPAGQIVEEVTQLVKNGYKEIVFTGVDISDYGADLPGRPNLGQLVKRVLKLVPDLKRLRLSSLDVVEIDDDLFEQFATDSRLLPHIHLSLQAGDDIILKRMKRRHLSKDIVRVVENLRNLRPDVVFGADIIAGFPTETDEMFQNTYNLLKETDITYFHVFSFSAHSNTPASKMPQVKGEIIKERARILRELGREQLNKFLQTKLGKKEIVMVESSKIARSDQYAIVKLEGDHNYKSGDLIEVEFAGIDNESLIGKIKGE